MAIEFSLPERLIEQRFAALAEALRMKHRQQHLPRTKLEPISNATGLVRTETDRRDWLRTCALFAVITCTGCSGYRFGAGSLYRPDVQTVSVSIAQSDSLRPYLGERLTEAVIREIHLQTPYRVTTADKAQTFLQLNLQNDTKSVLGENVNDEPRSLQVGMQIAAAWTNRSGQSLTTRPGLIVLEQANFVPEGGQSLTTAQQDAIDRLARQIVAQMESDW